MEEKKRFKVKLFKANIDLSFSVINKVEKVRPFEYRLFKLVKVNKKL